MSEPKVLKTSDESTKRMSKRTKTVEQTKTPVKSHVSPIVNRMSSRKRQSSQKLTPVVTKSPRPVRTPTVAPSKTPMIPISPPMRTLPANIPTESDKEIFKKAQDEAERQFVTTILTPLKRQPNLLCDTKVIF